MPCWNHFLTVLLAARGELPRMWGRFDHQRPSSIWPQLLMIAAAMAAAMAAVFIWHRLSGRSTRDFAINSPPRLFRELARAHKLSYGQRRLLKRFAAARGLTSPALLFVEPQHWTAANLPAELEPRSSELKALRHRLFG